MLIACLCPATTLLLYVWHMLPVSDVLVQHLDKESCLLWICHPHNGTAVPCGSVITSVTEPVTNMQHLQQNTAPV